MVRSKPRWILTAVENDVELMSRTLGISEIMAVCMLKRGVNTKNSAIKYLNPRPEYLSDGRLLENLAAAVSLTLYRMGNGEKIVVYGDYDVDGVCAATIMCKALKRHGADVRYYIPHREREGYGLNAAAVETLAADGAGLIITCDSGISAVEEIRRARRLGVDVIVLDHHEPRYTETDGARANIIPEATLIVDPKLGAGPSPFDGLCAAALAYKFAKLLYQQSQTPFEEEDEFLVFAMLATFCDIVPLTGENRIIAKLGLEILNRNRGVNKGLAKLIELRGLMEKEIDDFAVGFIIGPCINAAGRLESAALAVELFMSGDEGVIANNAALLYELNERRKALTAACYDSLIGQIGSDGGRGPDKIMLVYDEAAPESVMGIVAGRLRERFCRPVIVLTRSGGAIKGSARSIEGYNIFQALLRHKELFSHFGGHYMAAGLTLADSSAGGVDDLRRVLNEECGLTPDDLTEKLYIDAELPIERATYALAAELARLAPFGRDNRQPLFVAAGLTPEYVRVIEAKNTLLLSFGAGAKTPSGYGRSFKTICFGMVDYFTEQASAIFSDGELQRLLAGIVRGVPLSMDILYTPEIDEYKGEKQVQGRLIDFTLKRRGE